MHTVVQECGVLDQFNEHIGTRKSCGNNDIALIIAKVKDRLAGISKETVKLKCILQM